MPNGSKYYCYTDFNFDPDEENYNNWSKMEEEGFVQYHIYQTEISPKTKKIHLQGYIVFTKRITKTTIKKYCPSAHLEYRKGTHNEAKHYCQKPVPLCNCAHCTDHDAASRLYPHVEFGDDSDVPNGAGERTDWKKIIEMAKSGKYVEIMDEYPSQFIHAYKGIERVFKLHEKKRDYSKAVEFEVYWGPPGTGKSKFAKDQNPDAFILSDASSKWWDGYFGESVVIVNDFRGSNMKMSRLLNLTDRYEQKVEVKGSTVELNVTKWIFTSNYHPSKWYKKEWDLDNPLRRRISKIVEFKKTESVVINEPMELVFNSDSQTFEPSTQEMLDFGIPIDLTLSEESE